MDRITSSASGSAARGHRFAGCSASRVWHLVDGGRRSGSRVPGCRARRAGRPGRHVAGPVGRGGSRAAAPMARARPNSAEAHALLAEVALAEGDLAGSSPDINEARSLGYPEAKLDRLRATGWPRARPVRRGRADPRPGSGPSRSEDRPRGRRGAGPDLPQDLSARASARPSSTAGSRTPRPTAVPSSG